MQDLPFPVNPALQEHEQDPTLFVQRAFELHEEDEAAHSLTSKSMKWNKHKKQIISGKNSV